MKFKDYIFSRMGERYVWIKGVNNSVDCDIMQGLARIPRDDLEKEIKHITGTTSVTVWLSDQPDADPDYFIDKVR